MEEWKPGIRHDLLQGVSARAHATASSWLISALFASIAVMVVGMLVTGDGYLDHPVTAVAFGLIVLFAVLSAVQFGLASARRKSEMKAGYTTTFGPDSDSFLEVDPVSRQVIRLPGEDLSTKEYRRRLALIRGEGQRH